MGTTNWRSRAAGAVLSLFCCVSLAACTGGAPVPPDQPSPPTVEQRVVPVGAQDRDGDVMAQALANLDPCALLDEALTATVRTEPTIWRELYACTIDDVVRVMSYESLDQDTRFWWDPVGLGGAVGYRNSPLLSACEIALPVSFTHAILFRQEAGDEYDCSLPEDYAEAAAARLLADPTSAGRPDLREAVIACDILEQAVGEVPDGTTLRPSGRTPLADCGVWDEPNELGFVATHPRSSLTLTIDRPTGADGGDVDGEPLTVGDTTLVRTAGGDLCEYTWDAWEAIQPNRPGDVVAASLGAETCEDAAALAEAVVPLLAAATPADPGADTLLYPAGTPDGPAVGPCVDALAQAVRECAPATPADVPDDPADFLALGELDPDVVCAAASDIVRDVLGDALKPVTLLSDAAADPRLVCELVQPDHGLVVQVSASTGTLASMYWDETEIAGHTAVVDESATDRITSWVALGDATEPGMLEVDMVVMPTRNQGYYGGADIDRGPLDHYDELVERLVTELLE